MFAQIRKSKVVEILDVEDLPPMHPDAAALYVECDSSVEVGYTYQGSVFSAPPVEE